MVNKGNLYTNLNLIGIYFKSDSSVSGDVGGLIIVVLLVQLLVELADIIRHRSVSRRRLLTTLALNNTLYKHDCFE